MYNLMSPLIVISDGEHPQTASVPSRSPSCPNIFQERIRCPHQLLHQLPVPCHSPQLLYRSRYRLIHKIHSPIRLVPLLTCLDAAANTDVWAPTSGVTAKRLTTLFGSPWKTLTRGGSVSTEPGWRENVEVLDCTISWKVGLSGHRMLAPLVLSFQERQERLGENVGADVDKLAGS